MKQIETFQIFLKRYLVQRWNRDDIGVMPLESTTPNQCWQIFRGLTAHVIYKNPGKSHRWMEAAQWIAQKIEEKVDGLQDTD